MEHRVTVTRYVITYMGRHGLRTLLGPAQGRYTYAGMEEAEQHRAAILRNNNAETLARYGDPNLIEVRPCECWAGHFDPVGIYFD